ncbi:hypothetical protein G7054_g12458 [Neopestalotiopsis clavispora]|nr:hypothetical protein G7054_g12458 [Neopestalotiopsis clavispora]
MTASPIRVAIIGGGLAGATLANALVRIPHLQIQVYESAPEFSERGAAIGLATNFQQALAQIIPSAKTILEKAGAVAMNSSRIVLGSGPEAGNVVLDLAGAGDPGVVVHRASLLRELLAPLPKEILHANKKLTNIKNDGDGIQLTFQNGRIDSFDAIIGADGIFGKVREHVVGDNAEYKASPAGFWDCRILMPFEKAQKTIGPEFFELDRQYGWIGDQAFIMHDVLENRTMVQVVISAIEKDHPKDRKRPLSRELATATLSKWLDGPIASSVIEASSSITAKPRAPRLILLQLMMDEPVVQAYSQWEHKKTPTFYDGRTCIVGDAAHATTPWQGAGAGQAIEDAMILGHLLSHVTSKDQVNAAFEAYNTVRQPRCQQVIDSSRGTGLIFCGQNSEIGLDPAKLRSLVPPRWGFIMALDMEAHKQDALNKMKEILGRK